MTQPEMIVIGGPNGAGKSTFADQFLDLNSYEFLNADLEALKINPQSPESVAIAAGQQFLKRLEELVERQNSFLLESTLSGRTLLKRICQASDASFYTSTVFIFPISGDMCVARVGERVRKGGHHVPTDDIRRRYGRSLVNFWKHYRFATDDWSLYYNSGSEFVEVAYGEGDNFRIVSSRIFAQFQSMVNHYA